MLKWTVYGKKTQDVKPLNDYNDHNPQTFTNGPYSSRQSRRSLDGQSAKKSKKPSRYQRRSLGSAAIRKNNIKAIDNKENINFIGNTPNYFKEGFVAKKSEISFALKDVSNITPTSTPVKPKDRQKNYLGSSKEAIPPDLPPTPPSYSRKIREAKKRKLEMASLNNNDNNFCRDRIVCKSERRVNFQVQELDSAPTSSNLSHSRSESSLNDLSDRLEASRCSYRHSIAIAQQAKRNGSVSTTKPQDQCFVEIEYDQNLILNCVEQPIIQSNKNSTSKPSTLPIFGHHIFKENPLYFNKNDLNSSQLRPLKRIRRISDNLENSFTSPFREKKDLHTLVRDACSPISMTPLSMKLAALRFSTLSTHTKSQRVTASTDITDLFPRTENTFIILRDEETSTEMENKFILCKDSINNVTESTLSTAEMGDITLEKMIDDIIKSTKKVKSRRKILDRGPLNFDINKNNEENLEILSSKDLFVKPKADNKLNLIREAKYVNLSRENSISPQTSPNKKRDIGVGRNSELRKSFSNLPVGTFILDEEYNEREVKTPDSIVERRRNSCLLERSQSMHTPSHNVKTVNLSCASSESTPDLYSSFPGSSNLRLRRQRCIRRKKSTVSNESSWRKQLVERKSILTLDDGIPSPASDANISICDPLSSSFDCVVGPICRVSSEPANSSPKSNISYSSLMLQDEYSDRNKRSRELFGLTLENGIPSPITPIANLKRPSCNLSEERANKTSKLDEEIKSTPVIEHKSSRRCLTFSSEEGSINCTDEKRQSEASNRLEKSLDKFQSTKGTIDLEITTRNETIDVHVIRCRDLQRLCGRTDDINAYAKVVISGVNENQSLSSQRSVFQRTSVLYGKKEPEFQRHLKMHLPSAIYDQQMLHVSVWHRDKIYRRSEFLGCVSFPLKDAIKSDISGTYFLQSQVSGRNSSTYPTASAQPTAPGPDHHRDRCLRDSRDDGRMTGKVEDKNKMATDHIEATTNEESKDIHNGKGMSSNGPTTASQTQASAAMAMQKEADEHLFLRYLELDPPEDPAAPRKTQRHGRTPFTTTRKLSRGSGSGFGFTLVWTRPPRVERVANGGSAERAGLRSGDYIVFVGNKNVVTSSEEEVRNLVKSAGPTLQLETFRRVPQNGIGQRQRMSQVSLPVEASPPLAAPRSPRAAPASPAPAPRPPTACSSTSQSLDRRKLHLPQVTFSKETSSLNNDGRKRALLAVVTREQHFATCLQFGVGRFVSPLAERADLIMQSDHQLLFQNIEEILRLSEDILDQVVQEDGEIQTSTVIAVYLQKTPLLLSLYRKYCLGLKRADCVLVKKSKDPSGAFARFCTSPPIPRRRPDITSLVHKPLEQFRELLRLMRAAAASKGTGPYEQLEKKQLQAIAEQLQNGYQDVTAGSGLMGLAGDGKPLLSVSDLESRLVFTRCKPFVLSTGGRQWIFGGELSRVEGRAVRPYWALLFTDLLLFATVSRDRVLFVTEEPVALATVSEAQFNVRKKATEFRLVLGRSGGESPLVSCSLRIPGRTRTVVLRAPTMDLKAVWQSLLQRQIYRAHTMSGTPLGSPLDSPDPHLSFSLATLDSQQRQTRRSSAEASGTGAGTGAEGVPRSSRSRGSSIHLQRWMTQLPESEAEMEHPEQDLEIWSIEELRRRSKELNLLEVDEIDNSKNELKNNSPNEKKENERSPSKSSNSGSQITVRTSPVVVDTIPVCRQCHQKCLSKPNSPLVSQKDHLKPNQTKATDSPQNSNSNKSTYSECSIECDNHNHRKFCTIQRKGAMRIRPEDAPKAAMKVIDSIEQKQKMLKSTSYELKTDSPILSRSVRSVSKSPSKSQLELKREFCNSGRSPSPCSSSRNNSPLSTSHTTCSSMVFNSSSNDLRMSNSNIANQVQYVIAQEKYLNEVKCVENITLSKNKQYLDNNNTLNQSPGTIRKELITRQKAENVLNKVLGMNIITKRENVSCLNTSSVFLEEEANHNDDNEVKINRGLRRSPRMGLSAVAKMNGDVKKTDLNTNSSKGSDVASDDDLELGPLMLMGLSAINPAAHLMRVEPFKRTTSTNNLKCRPGNFEVISKSESPVPNISVVPPTPEYFTNNNSEDLQDDSPDSPLPEEPPYMSLKRYGTLSSLERFPSDETDDGNVRLTSEEIEPTKAYNSVSSTGGIMGWTARAGSFVVEKMNIFSTPDMTILPTTAITNKQPTFLERCLGVSDWKAIASEEGTAEPGDGSGASGEEAWGTPSSGDLSDNQPDSEHGTLSSPTKSSSSYAGDDDTELMMDELLMAPTITGPTIRPLLPRRRLEPLLEEDCSDSGSEDNKPTPTNPESQVMSHNVNGPLVRRLTQDSARGPFADGCFDAPRLPPSVSASGAEEEVAGGAHPRGGAREGGQSGGVAFGLNPSPDRTPTNELPSLTLQSVLKDSMEVRSGAATAGAGCGRRGSASSASTPSTLERTTIHNPSTPPNLDSVTDGVDPVQESSQDVVENAKQGSQAAGTPPEERLSPRAEMRLALDQGTDMLADQETPWVGGSDPWLWRAACQRSLLRRVASADAVTLCRPNTHLARRTVPHTTSRNSVYAWKTPESEEKNVMEMELLAQAEVQTMRSRTRSQCQNGKIMGFLRRRASSDSPRRELTSFGAPRPFSPRRTTEKHDQRFWKQVNRRRQSCDFTSQV